KLRMAMIKQRLNRIDILHRVVDKLKAKGYDLRFGQLGAIAGLRSIQLYTVAALLVKNGYGTDTSKVKKELVNPIAKEVLREDPSLAYMKPEEAIKLIHDAGGVAILAHPQRNIPDYDPATLKTWLNDLSAAGLDGAEAFRADIPADKGELIEAISKDAGLLVSGGSDFHQFDWKGGGHHPGEAKMSVSVWPEIEKRIESRGGYTDFRDLPIPTSATPNAQERFLLGR
ncbi:hypothetical protein KAI87_17365, partial [Myxococcota bacterium]|nr:hypothetical protein [Myxococcota bacterium]